MYDPEPILDRYDTDFEKRFELDEFSQNSEE